MMAAARQEAGRTRGTRAAMVTVVTVTLATAGMATADAGSSSEDYSMRVSDRFAAPGGGSPVPGAVTYDRRMPEGAEIQVGQRIRDKGMKIEVAVRGAASRYTYGVHVHTRPCGKQPASSGPHYQHRKDPKQPSVSARYANPRNEVWLDFSTDRNGNGSAVARQKWTFREGEARSVVLHEHRTSVHDGHAGQAGDRLACFTVPFDADADASPSGIPSDSSDVLAPAAPGAVPGGRPSGETNDLPS